MLTWFCQGCFCNYEKQRKLRCLKNKNEMFSNNIKHNKIWNCDEWWQMTIWDTSAVSNYIKKQTLQRTWLVSFNESLRGESYVIVQSTAGLNDMLIILLFQEVHRRQIQLFLPTQSNALPNWAWHSKTRDSRQNSAFKRPPRHKHSGRA